MVIRKIFGVLAYSAKREEEQPEIGGAVIPSCSAAQAWGADQVFNKLLQAAGA